jgi:hypothetical protein
MLKEAGDLKMKKTNGCGKRKREKASQRKLSVVICLFCIFRTRKASTSAHSMIEDFTPSNSGPNLTLSFNIRMKIFLRLSHSTDFGMGKEEEGGEVWVGFGINEWRMVRP